MHDIAPLVTSTVVIFVGILAGILFNQRAIDKLESTVTTRIDKQESRMENRMDRIESRIDRIFADMVEFFKMLSRHEEAIETLKKRQ